MSAITETPLQDCACQDCGNNVTSPALKCDVRSGCGSYTHLQCSGLPAYYLVRLEVTLATFLCKTCIQSKAGENYNDKLKRMQDILNEGMEPTHTATENAPEDVLNESENHFISFHGESSPAPTHEPAATENPPVQTGESAANESPPAPQVQASV